MKFRRWRIHLPFRDFQVEFEDLVPALAATIGKVVMVTAMVAAFASQFGLSPEFVAENVAKDYDSAIEAFDGWLNSSSHKKTMEDNFTHTAVSVKVNNAGDFYFTQIFFR